MKKQLETRINELQSEFDSGKKILEDYESKSAELNQMLLRISGAIQVLKEEVEKLSIPEVDESDVSFEREKQSISKSAVSL